MPAQICTVRPVTGDGGKPLDGCPGGRALCWAGVPRVELWAGSPGQGCVQGQGCVLGWGYVFGAELGVQVIQAGP